MMKQRFSLLLVLPIWFLLTSIPSGGAEPKREKEQLPRFTLIHPEAKDPEAFFQSRRVKTGYTIFRSSLGAKKTDFGWVVFLSQPRSNFSGEPSYGENVKVLDKDFDLARFEDGVAIILSEHPDREYHWEVAGFIDPRPAEAGANGFDADPRDLITSEKWRFRQALPDALAGLKDPDHRVRAQSAEALGWIGNDARIALPELVQLVSDTNAEVAVSAMQSIGFLGGPEAAKAVPALIDAIGPDYTGTRAIECLGRLGESAKEAVPALIEALSSKELNGKAIQALGKIAPEDPRVKKALAPFLDHESDFLRKTAAEALAIDPDGAEAGK